MTTPQAAELHITFAAMIPGYEEPVFGRGVPDTDRDNDASYAFIEFPLPPHQHERVVGNLGRLLDEAGKYDFKTGQRVHATFTRANASGFLIRAVEISDLQEEQAEHKRREIEARQS